MTPAPKRPDRQSALSLVEDARMDCVLALAETAPAEADHCFQVMYLALELFDQLQPLHGLDSDARFLLAGGALLHDIGRAAGARAHHKISQRLILAAPLPELSEREKNILACLARHHRRSAPSVKHQHFVALPDGDKRLVRVLAGILRVADGLDRRHLRAVHDIYCEVLPDKIVLRCDVAGPAETERDVALEKGDVFEEVFQRSLAIEWRNGP